MASKKRCISVPSGVVDKLIEETKSCRSAVYYSLRYERDSEVARKIRDLALTKYGGRMITKIVW